MAIKYLPEESIYSAFPTTKTTTINKLFTENSITRLINKLIDTDKYILTPDNSEVFLTDKDGDLLISNYTETPFEFVIHGYYFEISNLNDILSMFSTDTSKAIWARIVIDTQVEGYPELLGQINEDDSSVANQNYLGIQFIGTTYSGTTDEPIPPEAPVDAQAYEHCYDLLIAKKKIDGSAYTNWVVPSSSLFKFATKSIKNIDGGQLPASSSN